MKFGSLFAGIGGIDLGLERAGMECYWQVEIDDFCQKVLTKHWPDVPKYRDVRDVGKRNLEPVDLIAGGFPCQPFSVAGKQRGTEDDRHLWPEMLRIIAELKPTWVLGENVPGIIPIFLDQALTDLEDQGYTCESFVLPACAFDAPHRRDRLFIIAYTNKDGKSSKPVNEQWKVSRTMVPYTEGEQSGRIQQREISSNALSSCEYDAYADQPGLSSRNEQKGIGAQKETPAGSKFAGAYTERNWRPLTVEPTIRGMDDGVPDRVDRLKSLGNAVVPQVAEFIGRMIMTADNPPTNGG